MTLLTFLFALHIAFPFAIASQPPPEEQATLAFHVSVNEHNLPLLPRFLHRIYHPDNLYLVTYTHPLTLQSPPLVRPNIHYRTDDPSVVHGVSQVLNLLDAISYFLDRELYISPEQTSFDYFIHTSPAEYPTLNPDHMRRVLALHARQSPPPNFFHFSHPSQAPLRSSHLNTIFSDMSLTFNRTVHLSLHHHNIPHPDTHRRPLSIPHADSHFVINHHFATLATDSFLSKRLLLTLAETSHVLNHFFPALAVHAPHSVGPLVRSTSLRCPNSPSLDLSVTEHLPNLPPQQPTIQLLNTSLTPCLFSGPFSADTSVRFFDAIDRHFLIPPGTQGKPPGPGFHDRVIHNMQTLAS